MRGHFAINSITRYKSFLPKLTQLEKIENATSYPPKLRKSKPLVEICSFAAATNATIAWVHRVLFQFLAQTAHNRVQRALFQFLANCQRYISNGQVQRVSCPITDNKCPEPRLQQPIPKSAAPTPGKFLALGIQQPSPPKECRSNSRQTSSARTSAAKFTVYAWFLAPTI